MYSVFNNSVFNNRMSPPLLLCFFLTLYFAAAPGAEAQEWAAELRLSRGAVVSMVTIYPGEALYSMFGHTAIRVWDPEIGLDILYNYGQASVPFDASFVPRFVSGDLPFILGVSETQRSYDYYIRYEDRSIYEQVLNLSPARKQRVFDFLAENARKENRIYIYDFFFDNCTTRIRDMFVGLFGEDLRYGEEIFEKPVSYRSEISPYLEEKGWVKFGIDLMLGLPADKTPGREQQLYLPLPLMEAMESARIKTGEEYHPLIRDSFFVYEQTRAQKEASPVSPTLFFWGVFLLALVLSVLPLRLEFPLRLFDLALFLLPGFIGTASVLLWAGSGYLMTHWNLNLLWAWPSHLLAAFLFLQKTGSRNFPAPIDACLRACPAVYLGLSAVLSLLAVVFSPLLPQTFPSAALPLALSLALRASLRALKAGRRRSEARRTDE